MSANSVEKNAQRLGKLLRDHGKDLGKQWRLRVRELLNQTFVAMNARPLNGFLCLQLSDKIDAELAALKDIIEQDDNPDAVRPVKKSSEHINKSSKKSKNISNPSCDIPDLDVLNNNILSHNVSSDEGEVSPCAAMGGAHTPLPPQLSSGVHITQNVLSDHPESPDSGNSNISDAGNIFSVQHKIDGEPGLFDFIHIQIRCIIKIRAVVKPPYIGKFVMFSEHFADVKEDRIEAFIRVLQNNSDDIGTKLDVEVGYDDDLIPDMPDRGLVLHQKRKKR